MTLRRGRSYRQDLRDKMPAAIDRGTEPRAVAALFEVSVSWIYKVLGRRRSTAETVARPCAQQTDGPPWRDPSPGEGGP